MSILRDEVHQAVEQLPEDELAAILAIVRRLGPASDSRQRWPLPSWVGMADSGDPDFSEHSEDYLRSIGDNPADASTTNTSRAAHRLSFTAAGSGPVELIKRAEDYLRTSALGLPNP